MIHLFHLDDTHVSSRCQINIGGKHYGYYKKTSCYFHYCCCHIRLAVRAIMNFMLGGTLAMLYAYRDAEESPIPVKMMLEMVGP